MTDKVDHSKESTDKADSAENAFDKAEKTGNDTKAEKENSSNVEEKYSIFRLKKDIDKPLIASLRTIAVIFISGFAFCFSLLAFVQNTFVSEKELKEKLTAINDRLDEIDNKLGVPIQPITQTNSSRVDSVSERITTPVTNCRFVNPNTDIEIELDEIPIEGIAENMSSCWIAVENMTDKTLYYVKKINFSRDHKWAVTIDLTKSPKHDRTLFKASIFPDDEKISQQFEKYLSDNNEDNYIDRSKYSLNQKPIQSINITKLKRG